MESTEVHAEVQRYYGEVLATSADLKTNACCPTESIPQAYRQLLAMIHPEIQERFYGCGSPLPMALDGCTVLDLGCGTGRDSYMLAKLVGPHGYVHGVDMTAAQLAVAERHLDYHMAAFGHQRPNISFHLGQIEDLQALGIADESIDLVVSNCVINLAPNKERVFREIFRVLKPGGELVFADIFAGCRLPAHLASDPVLIGECLGGAMYIEDFRRLMLHLGCADYRTVSSSPVAITAPELAAKLGLIRFTSQTIRAFKHTFEDRCEDYGQSARYLGTLPESPDRFKLDQGHVFETGKIVPVCGNTALMLSQTRYAPHFHLQGDMSRHFGIMGGPGESCEPGSGCC